MLVGRNKQQSPITSYSKKNTWKPESQQMERNCAQKYSNLERTGYLDLMQFQLQSSQKKTTNKTFLQKSERFVQIRLD